MDKYMKPLKLKTSLDPKSNKKFNDIRKKLVGDRDKLKNKL